MNACTYNSCWLSSQQPGNSRFSLRSNSIEVGNAMQAAVARDNPSVSLEFTTIVLSNLGVMPPEVDSTLEPQSKTNEYQVKREIPSPQHGPVPRQGARGPVHALVPVHICTEVPLQLSVSWSLVHCALPGVRVTLALRYWLLQRLILMVKRSAENYNRGPQSMELHTIINNRKRIWQR